MLDQMQNGCYLPLSVYEIDRPHANGLFEFKLKGIFA
jgi:hypothetical protein